jgi:hypothetical protein
MSYSLDSNVLIYASDRSSQSHDAARRFLDQCASGSEILCLAWPTVMSYLRIATHPRIFSAPLSPREAIGNIHALLALPHVRPVAELDDFMTAYARVVGDVVIRGNLVPDAHLATVLYQHGVRTFYTSDSDFLKFPVLDVRNPFDAT